MKLRGPSVKGSWLPAAHSLGTSDIGINEHFFIFLKPLIPYKGVSIINIFSLFYCIRNFLFLVFFGTFFHRNVAFELIVVFRFRLVQVPENSLLRIKKMMNENPVIKINFLKLILINNFLRTLI